MPKILGVLNNCSLNCSLSILLKDIQKLSKLEEERKLPNDLLYCRYSLLKHLFYLNYGIKDEGSWRQFHAFLAKKSFTKIQYIFLPVLRDLIYMLAGSNFVPQKLDYHDGKGEVLAVVYRDLEPDGKFKKLDVMEAYDFLHQYFCITMHNYTDGIDGGLIPRENAPIAPAWATQSREQDIYYFAEHYEQHSPAELAHYTSIFGQEAGSFSQDLRAIEFILNSSASPTLSSLGLAKLTSYINQQLLLDRYSDEDFNITIHLKESITHIMTSGCPRTSRLTKALSILEIATKIPEYTEIAHELLSQQTLTTQQIDIILAGNDIGQNIQQIAHLNEQLILSLISGNKQDAIENIQRGANLLTLIKQEDGENKKTLLSYFMHRQLEDQSKKEIFETIIPCSSPTLIQIIFIEAIKAQNLEIANIAARSVERGTIIILENDSYRPALPGEGGSITMADLMTNGTLRSTQEQRVRTFLSEKGFSMGGAADIDPASRALINSFNAQSGASNSGASRANTSQPTPQAPEQQAANIARPKVVAQSSSTAFKIITSVYLKISLAILTIAAALLLTALLLNPTTLPTGIANMVINLAPATYNALVIGSIAVGGVAATGFSASLFCSYTADKNSRQNALEHQSVSYTFNPINQSE